jgi:hypothetical protein
MSGRLCPLNLMPLFLQQEEKEERKNHLMWGLQSPQEHSAENSPNH